MLNLSIGGPDFMDHPFVDKVGPVSAGACAGVVAAPALTSPLCLVSSLLVALSPTWGQL